MSNRKAKSVYNALQSNAFHNYSLLITHLKISNGGFYDLKY